MHLSNDAYRGFCCYVLCMWTGEGQTGQVGHESEHLSFKADSNRLQHQLAVSLKHSPLRFPNEYQG